jgi:hypothetical protein
VAEVTGWEFRGIQTHGKWATMVYRCGEGEGAVLVLLEYLMETENDGRVLLRFDRASVMGKMVGVFYSREIGEVERFLGERELPKLEIKDVVWW